MDSNKLLTVSSSPHIHAEEDTRSIMLDVIIALVPVLAVSVYFFGWRTLIITVVSVLSCVIFEYLSQRIMKRPVTVGDLSAVVTGMLFAYTLPPSVPYWVIIAGAFFAIVIVKQLFGGLGKNFVNPALAARAFLFSWPVFMTTWPLPSTEIPIFGEFHGAANTIQSAVDAVTGATPLAMLDTISHGTAETAMMAKANLPSLFQMMVGMHAGSLGETSALVLVLGGIYLLIRRVIHARIPLAFIFTVAALSFLFPPALMPALDWMFYSVLSGGLLLGAIFMATDSVTSPMTPRGQLIFGIGCGLITVFIRQFCTLPEGVCYAILIMNLFSWVLDRTGYSSILGRRARLSADSRDGGAQN